MTAKSTHTCITLDYDCLRQEVTQHRNHPTIKTHEITKGLERRESWKSQMHQLKKDLSNLMTMVNIYNISCTDVNIKELNYKVSILQNMIWKQSTKS